MKKAFPVNINGKVFYIDEDAYSLLINYLDQLKSAFPLAEGEEIVADIESRIAELFDERVNNSANVIVLADVNRVIEIMGQPSDFSGNENQDFSPENPSSTDINSDSSDTTPEVQNQPDFKKRLYRSVDNKVLGGVLGGLATYLNWDANIMRVLFVVITIMTYFWPLSLLYLVAWMIIPPANTSRRILEMNGEPVTVSSIGRTILSSATPPPYPDNRNSVLSPISSFFSVIGNFIGKCILGILGIAGALGALVATGFALLFLFAIVAGAVFNSFEVIEWFNNSPSLLIALFDLLLAICFIIPSIAFAWIAVCVIFNAREATKTTVWLAVVLEVVFIVATVIIMIYADIN